MSTIDITPLGWGKLYRQDNVQVCLPQELTKKWWDKQKQVIAKGTETGVGEELDKLKKLFDVLLWPNIGRGSHPEVLKVQIKECTQHANSAEIKKFREQLDEVHKVAKKWALTWKKNPLLKKTVSALEDIRDVSDQIKVACLGSSLGTALDQALKAAVEGASQKTEQLIDGNLVDLAKKFVQDLPGLLKDMETRLGGYQESPTGKVKSKSGEVSTRNWLAESVSNVCRRATTLLGNLCKADEGKVVGFNKTSGEKLNEMISVISGDKDFKFAANWDPKTVGAEVKKVATWMQAVKTLVQKIEAG